jgi:hypothetical protein
MSGFVSVIIKVLIVAALLGLAYYVHNYLLISEGFSTIEKLGAAPLEVRPPLRKPIEVVSSGPNAPSAAPKLTMPTTYMEEPQPSDPMDDQVESADAMQKMRYPERSFGPGKEPSDTAIAMAGGIASKATALTAQSAQSFSPELVTNGGMFFGDVAPLESDNPNYTAF